jgi:alanine dehydrogenase
VVVLILDEKDVESLIDIPSTVQTMEDAFKELGRNKVLMPVRSRLSVPGSFGTLRIMPASLLDSRVSGLKVLTGTAGHRREGENYFVVLLHDYDDGALKCIMSANRLTQLRTGALSAVATKVLARKDSRILGLIGAGIQGRGQLEAILAVLNFEKVLIYDVMRDNAKKLLEIEASKFRDVKFFLAHSIDEITEQSDVISTSTTSSATILNASNVREGTHVNAIGSNLPSRKELDPSILQVAKIVVDSLDQAIEESGDLEPIKEGVLPKDRIYAELSEVLTGKKAARTQDEEITIFKSVGVALQDIAVANLLYQEAIRRKLGREFRL